MPAAVDADLFDNLQQAIDFVAKAGGGVVYTEHADSLYGKAQKVPPNVKLVPRRPEPDPRACDWGD